MKKESDLPSGMVNKPAMNKPAMGKPTKPGAEVTMPGFPSGRPTKPGKPMKPGISKLPAGMVNKPAMNKSPMQEAIRRMRGNK